MSSKAVGQRGSAHKPNIIFILADDLGYGDLGCYGQELIKIPNIDRRAGEGIRFTRAYAGSAACDAFPLLPDDRSPRADYGQALRMSDWKAVRRGRLDAPIELYNLASDVGEGGMSQLRKLRWCNERQPLKNRSRIPAALFPFSTVGFRLPATEE